MAGEKILIVDDEFDTLRLVGLMLERQGYKITAAENGHQALDVLANEKPDLILLDVMMPGMDGVEVARRIRANPKTEDIPIIMFTAKSQVEDKVSGLEAGADVYLTKPTQPRELFAQVKVLLARSKKSKTIPLPIKTKKSYMIGVLSAKGGLGVSTVAINLGITIQSQTKKDVIIMDCHPGRGDLSWDLGISNPRGLDNLLLKDPAEITPEEIKSELSLHESGIRLIIGSQHALDAIQILKTDHFKAIARNLGELADYVILDLGSTLMPSTQSLAKMSNELLILVEPTPNNLRRTKDLIDNLNKSGINTGISRLILNNRLRSSVQLNWSQVEQELGQKLAAVFTPAPELAYQASSIGRPMVVQQSQSTTAQQYAKLANIITKQSEI